MEIIFFILIIIVPILIWNWVKALFTKWVWNETLPKMTNHVNKISTKQAYIINVLKNRKK